MPDFRIRETGEVISDSEFRLRHKHTSFPRIIDEPLQEEFGIDMIFEGPQRQGPPPYSYTYRDGIEEINGRWYTKYTIGERDREEIDNRQADNVRIQRDRLIKRHLETWKEEQTILWKCNNEKEGAEKQTDFNDIPNINLVNKCERYADKIIISI